jgi:adenine phosphoribosyltransferase
MDLKTLIRDIPDYPKPGITFKDITPLLKSPSGLAMAVEQMANPFRGKGVELVCGAESRGFIFGTAIAQSLSAGFVPIRKPNKLPHEVRSKSYELEYGHDTLEIHTDAITKGQKVLMVDDLLATGGTLQACLELVQELGADVVGVSLAIELSFLEGRKKIAPFDNIHAVMSY